MAKIKVGVVGSAGYTGGELLRILFRHQQADIVFAHSNSNTGKYISEVHQDLVGDTEIKFSGDLRNDIDVLFLCVGHGEARKFLEENKIDEKIRVIDLSQDFRLTASAKIGGRNFVYGLPELNKEEIKSGRNIANPGCFATAIQLGLLPLAAEGLLGEVHTTGITGSTGAGQTLSPTSHFSWRADNLQAYKTLTHQHVKEIGESLHQLQTHGNIELNFVPWRGDFTRGIFVSSQLNCKLSLDELQKLYNKFYEGHPFTMIVNEPLFMKQVVNTNKCMIQLEKVGNKVVIHSAIDNLVKGASGQAIQNMNLMFGIEETEGLKLKANYF